MAEAEVGYYRRRERQERAAAKTARSLAARRIHQELAERYAGAIRTSVTLAGDPPIRVPSLGRE